MGVQKHIEKKSSVQEVKKMRADADLFVAGLQSLQKSISDEMKRIMEQDSIGFNELCERLGLTPRMISKMVKGGSVNFETITKLSLMNGKIPYIGWKHISHD